MTNRLGRVASVEMMFSLNPSARWSCALSPVRLLNGRTAIEGFVGSGKAILARLAGSTVASHGRHQTATTATAITAAAIAPSCQVFGRFVLSATTVPTAPGSSSTR